ncbi:membrane protein [Marinobacterium nitratireducens]|uniref:Membrane protein n=1 Tax=Marinobacterium nitratireducens TaxID=518897 RepID=A0A917ZB12_9GAMM|nr:HupE/UreJ family protein [Marinobacterium nitratireducens]GGO79318.1 membrane protein [Marinobacterium nitratireducens]
MRKLYCWLVLLGGLLLAGVTSAHEVRPAYLELRQVAGDTYDVLWKVPARGDDLRLGIYVRFPDGTEAVSEPAAVLDGGAYIESWRVRREGGLAGQRVGIAGLPATRIDVLVRVIGEGGATQTERLLPDNPGFVVASTPSAWGVASSYLGLGVEHILLGVDHLLFVLTLVLLVTGWKRLLGTITAFTLSHSLTLVAATLGLLQVPGPPVEACIALSIAFVAAEIVRGRQGGAPGLTARAPWLVAFAFGLLHGLGFAGALADLGLPQQAIPLALLFFNLGVELGQLAFIAVVLSFMAGLRRLPLPATGWGWRLAPYSIGAVSMFWLLERLAAF